MKKTALVIALLVGAGNVYAFPLVHKHHTKKAAPTKPAPKKKALGPTIPPPVGEDFVG